MTAPAQRLCAIRGWVGEREQGGPSGIPAGEYPSAHPTGFEYLKRSVKLEFGSLTDQQPTGRHAVQPWLAETLPVAFPDWRCEVVARVRARPAATKITDPRTAKPGAESNAVVSTPLP